MYYIKYFRPSSLKRYRLLYKIFILIKQKHFKVKSYILSYLKVNFKSKISARELNMFPKLRNRCDQDEKKLRRCSRIQPGPEKGNG